MDRAPGARAQARDGDSDESDEDEDEDEEDGWGAWALTLPARGDEPGGTILVRAADEAQAVAKAVRRLARRALAPADDVEAA